MQTLFRKNILAQEETMPWLDQLGMGIRVQVMIIEDGDAIIVCLMVFWMLAESLQSKRAVGCTCVGSLERTLRATWIKFQFFTICILMANRLQTIVATYVSQGSVYNILVLTIFWTVMFLRLFSYSSFCSDKLMRYFIQFILGHTIWGSDHRQKPFFTGFGCTSQVECFFQKNKLDKWSTKATSISWFGMCMSGFACYLFLFWLDGLLSQFMFVWRIQLFWRLIVQMQLDCQTLRNVLPRALELISSLHLCTHYC